MNSITVDGETILYKEVGEGPPFVFISGLGGLAEEWQADMLHFAKSMRCLSLEHPGIGGTPLPTERCGAMEMADRIAAGLRTLAVESATVLGMSLGGAVAQELALRHPNLVGRLVLTSAFARLDERAKRAISTLVKLMECGDLRTAIRMFYWVGFGATFYDKNLPALDAAVDEYVADPIDYAVFEYQLDACLTHDAMDRLGRIACPTLVTHGAADLLVRPYLAQELADGIPDARLVLLEDGGHSCNWEQPERFHSEVDAFIAATS